MHRRFLPLFLLFFSAYVHGAPVLDAPLKNVNTFSTVGAITSALDETTLIFTPFLSAAGLLTEWMLWKMGDTNFAEVSRGQMIDQLPGESPKVKVIKEVAKEASKQVLPVDKN